MQPGHQSLPPTWGTAHGIALQRALTGSLSQSGHSWACPSTQIRRWTRCASHRGEGSSGDAEQFVPIGCGILLVRCAPSQPPPSNQYMTRRAGQAAVHGSQTIPQRTSCHGAEHPSSGKRGIKSPSSERTVLGLGTSRQPSLERDQPPPSFRRGARAYGPSDRRSPKDSPAILRAQPRLPPGQPAPLARQPP